MTAALLCMVAQGAWAETESVTFQSRWWDSTNQKVVTTKDTKECTVISGSHPDDWLNITGWHVVKGDVKYKTIHVIGYAYIVLADGSTLTCTGGIKVEQEDRANLYIYSQSDGDQQGKLIVTNSYTNAAGIGGAQQTESGLVTIHGGDLDITGGKYGAGIGAGGSHDWFLSEHTFQSYASTTTIYGGKITARGGKKAAGIGGGDYASGGWFNLYGGTVNAYGGDYGSGIGGGFCADGSTVYIYGGTLNAYGGEDGAGIGGGENGSGKEFHIDGGTVRAEGKSYGSGIGGGEYGYGGDAYIAGGTVIAIAGKDCKCRTSKGGSAIGVGDWTNTGMEQPTKGNVEHDKKLEIADNMKVTGGDSESSIDAVFTADARVNACRWRNYVKIEACPHSTPLVGGDRSEAITYSIDDDIYHTKYCRYCNLKLQEEHSGRSCACGKANVYRFTTYKPGTEVDTYTEGFTIAIGVDMDFYLPTCQNIPEGYTFKGWEMNPDPDGGNKWLAVLGEDIMEAGTSVKALLGQDQANFYPRFLYEFTEKWEWADDHSSVTLTLSNPNLSDIVMTSAEGKDQLTTTDALDKEGNKCGSCYTATATYEVNGYEYQFSTKEQTEYKMVLADNDDNSETLEQYAGKKAATTLDGRTLYADGSWNTICLPFDLNENDLDLYLEYTDIKTLDTSMFDQTTGTLTLNFADADKIEAGKPYLIRWNAEFLKLLDASNEDAVINNPEYEAAVIVNSVSPITTNVVDFVGSFSPVPLTANDKSVLYLGADNKLYYPSTDMTIGSCRAYFQLKDGLNAGDLAASGAKIRLYFGDEETGIREISNPSNPSNFSDPYFTLDGRRLSSKPTQRGIFIHGGKKVIIK